MQGLKDLSKPLMAKDIEFRVQSINKGGYATILPYKDARADMKRLDACLGPGFWQRKHEFKNGILYCSVGVWNAELDQWVWVEDVGTESNAEAQKGQASDSFKRACVNLGIGRDLYAYPVISIKLLDGEWSLDKGKPRASWGLKLKEWKWYVEHDESGEPSFIAAKDQNQKMRFQWGERKRDES